MCLGGETSMVYVFSDQSVTDSVKNQGGGHCFCSNILSGV